MSTQLIPCPWCGRGVRTVGTDSDSFRLCRVICDTERCPAAGWNWKTRAEAEQAWNSRIDSWINTAELLPPNRVPVWVEREFEGDVFIHGAIMVDGQWSWPLPPMTYMRGRWVYTHDLPKGRALVSLGSDPIRWRRFALMSERVDRI